MSSAILYLAIIAIWAGVLIPRWLKRDSARGAAGAAASSSATEPPATLPDDAGTEPPATLPDDAGTEPPATLPDDAGTLPPGGTAPSDTATSDDAPSAEEHDAQPPAARVSREESRQRVLKARRRLLWMLLGLAIAGGALAGTRLAAWWVTVPPAVMLAGYLLLLREAAKADTEASQGEREALEARQAARARERARSARARQARAAAATAGPAVPVTYAAAPVPADYDDEGPGRDFTLGGRYVASALAADEDDAYDQYAEDRLRAVGD
jgi:hypothetical protein